MCWSTASLRLSATRPRIHQISGPEAARSPTNSSSDKELDDDRCEKPDGGSPSPPPTANGRHDDYDPEIHGFEILECKYRVAVTEVIDLKAELKALKEKFNQAVEGQADEQHGSHVAQDRVHVLDQQVSTVRACRSFFFFYLENVCMFYLFFYFF